VLDGRLEDVAQRGAVVLVEDQDADVDVPVTEDEVPERRALQEVRGRGTEVERVLARQVRRGVRRGDLDDLGVRDVVDDVACHGRGGRTDDRVDTLRLELGD